MNTLYYGDNLKILRDYIKDESVDLIYLDPPFNSNRNYNVLFRNEAGTDSESQITAFEDTWHWNLAAEQTYNELKGMPRLKRYESEYEGTLIQDIWTDINKIHNQSPELMGYPTQKPVALLERIIQASSNEGDLVLDRFCGCGTTITAAQKLNREWIGIDVTHLSVDLMKLRLKDSFGMVPVGAKTATKSSPPYEGGVAAASADGVVLSTTADQHSVESNLENHPTAIAAPVLRKEGSLEYRVIGQPEDLDGAKELAQNDRYGFQWWILPLIGAKAFGSEAGRKEGKKGGDKGIDGSMVFTDDKSGKAKRVVVSVKSGHVSPAHIRDLGHVIDRENAAIGVYLTLEPPTPQMLEEAAGKGFYKSQHFGNFPRLQILTLEEILDGRMPQLPPNLQQTFKQAETVHAESDQQADLFAAE